MNGKDLREQDEYIVTWTDFCDLEIINQLEYLCGEEEVRRLVNILDLASENRTLIRPLQISGNNTTLAADWQLQGSYEAAGQQLVLDIADTPGRSHQARNPQAQWRITSTTWSQGLSGQIAPNLVLQHGENRIPLEINMGTLTEAPSVQVVLQGPERAFQGITLDLRAMCVDRLEEKERLLTERSDRIDQYVQETDTNYQLPPETVTDPRVNREKQNELTTLLGRLTAFKTGYEEDTRAFSSNLETLEQTQVNENLAVFEANNKRLKDAIASLKSAQVQLQQQCTTAHMALFKTLENENQEAIDILLEDPKLDVNGRNEGGIPLICIATDKWNEEAIRKILAKRGNRYINTIYRRYTPLQIAIKKKSLGIFSLLLEGGADMNMYEKYQQNYFIWHETSSAPPVFIILQQMAICDEPEFNSLVEILDIMLEEGLDTSACYECFIPVEEYLKHSSCKSIDDIKIFEEVTKDNKYVKEELDLRDDPFCDLEDERLDRVYNLMCQYGWSFG